MGLGRVRRGLGALVVSGTAVLMVPSAGWAAHGDPRLSNVACIDVGATASAPPGAPGITEEGLREALRLAVKTKLPRLLVQGGCGDALRILVVLATPSPDVVYGMADLAFLRRAIVVDTGQFAQSESWRMTFVFHGSPEGAKAQLLWLLDDMLTHFAADYHRAGNS